MGRDTGREVDLVVRTREELFCLFLSEIRRKVIPSKGVVEV